jgi:peptidoglycan glycosyltransferase
MQFTHEIQRLLAGLLITFLVIGLVAGYWAVARSNSLLERDDNPRLFEETASILRGDILDRNGNVLATTVNIDDDFRNRRDYHFPEMNGAIGYYSLRFGEGGAEAAYNTLLNGSFQEDDFQNFFKQGILHYPQEGTDIRLTFDVAVQRAVVDGMGDLRGAAVVISVPDGEILAMVSLPTYDPNTLDAEWDQLITAPGDPFFNRALQGGYQPGASLYTMLATAALIEGIPLTIEYGNATDAVALTEVTLDCALQPESNTLTLSEAYLYGCPAPFAELANRLGEDSVLTTLDLFGLNTQFSLSGFTPEAPPEVEATEEATAEAAQELTLLDNALGQGSITITPLEMASIIAAYINAGNAPMPITLIETRPPNSDVWMPASDIHQTRPITTPETARRIQALLRRNVDEGSAQSAARDGLTIGGQTALAFSGEETVTWFVGFAQTGGREGVAIALALENTNNPDLVATIAGDALEAAVESLFAARNQD